MSPEGEDASREDFKWSRNGKYLAYVTTQNGSDWKKIRLFDLKKKKNVENEVITHAKFSGPTWDTNSKGFYYGRYDSNDEKDLKYKGTDPQELPHQRIFYHLIG